MKFLLQFMFLYLLPVMTCIESIRNVESNQRNVHRTHMFSKLHKGGVKLPANRKVLRQKLIHSISNANKPKSTSNTDSNLKGTDDKWISLSSLRKRQFTFVTVPYQRMFKGSDYYTNVKIREILKELMLQNALRSSDLEDEKKYQHHVNKRKAVNNVPPAGNQDQSSSDGQAVSLQHNDNNISTATSDSSSNVQVSENYIGKIPDGFPDIQNLPDSRTLSNLQDKNHEDVLPTISGSSSNLPVSDIHRPSGSSIGNETNAQDKNKSSGTQSKVNSSPVVPTPDASHIISLPHSSVKSDVTQVDSNSLHSTTNSPVKKITKETLDGVSSKMVSQTPSRKPISVRPLQHTTRGRSLPIQKPTEVDINSSLEKLQERTSETECKDKKCISSNVPGSRFSDGTWAMGSMTFILLLLTMSVLYTGLWKKRNHFIYGFKSREDGAVSQQFYKTTVSDVLRRINLTKKKEMIRLKRLFGNKYNRVPQAEGSDIEEEDSSV